MTISSADAVIYTLAFLVPGFLINWVLSAFVPPRKQDTQLLFLRFLTLSCVNYALCSAPLYFVIATNLRANRPLLGALIYFFVVFVVPVGLGLALGQVQ